MIRANGHMRIAIAVELFVQIWMRVEVHDRQPLVPAAERAHDWIRDRMIPSQTDRTQPIFEQLLYRRFDFPERIRLRQIQIAGIHIGVFCSEIDARLRPHIREFAKEGIANQRRRLCRTAQVRRIRVEGNAEYGGKGHRRTAYNKRT